VRDPELAQLVLGREPARLCDQGHQLLEVALKPARGDQDDPVARRRLTMVPDPRPVEIPGLISFVAAQARWGPDGRSQTARMLGDDGRWYLVNASVLDDRDAGNVAVVVQPAPAASVVDGALRALGLSAREREVAALSVQGHSTKSIASVLVISRWTAQDHLKSIYEKVGVSSRTELVSLVPVNAAASA
jgi:DNA-binding CsgD family transcriptional regulator